MKNTYLPHSENTSYWSNFPMHSLTETELNYEFPVKKKNKKTGKKLKKKEFKKLLKLMRKEGLVFVDDKKKKKSRKKKHKKKTSHSTLDNLLVACLPKVIDACSEYAIQKMKNSVK